MPGLLLDKYNLGRKRTPLGLNTSHEFSVHKVIARKKEVYGFVHRSKATDFMAVDNYDNRIIREPYSDYEDKIYDLKATSLGLGIRFYNHAFTEKWTLAPIGGFIDLKAYGSLINVQQYFPSNGENSNLSYGFSDLGLAIAVGRQSVIFSHLPISFSIQFNAPLSLYSAYFSKYGPMSLDFSEDFFYDENAIEPVDKEYLKASAHRRLFNKSVIEFKVGIGILAI